MLDPFGTQPSVDIHKLYSTRGHTAELIVNVGTMLTFCQIKRKL